MLLKLKINVSPLKKKSAPFVGLETIKFGLNFPMLLLFPKLHLLARFAMPWPFFLCTQIRSRGFKDKCEHLHNRTTQVATSKRNSLPVLTSPSSLLPPFLNTSLLLVLLFWRGTLTCSPCNGLSHQHSPGLTGDVACPPEATLGCGLHKGGY